MIPAIADLERAFIAGNTFLESARQNYSLELVADLPHKYTIEELEDVESRINASMTWLKENSAKQKQLARHDDPVLLTAEVKARGVTLQNHVLRLLRRKAPKPKKTTTSESATTTTEAVTDSSAEFSMTTSEGAESTTMGEGRDEGTESTPEHDEL